MSESIKRIAKRAPVLGRVARQLARRRRSFPGSLAYWDNRYRAGGTSGPGSYHHLAEFKAEVLNRFVEQHNIQTVIEFGCGDGNLLQLARYPAYVGLDVSPKAIQMCQSRFHADSTKSFYLYHSLAFADHAGLFQADLALSLDVILHLVEDAIFHAYLTHVFQAGRRYAIIYSSDFDAPQTAHVRHRQFTTWVAAHQPDWELQAKIDNRYPHDPERPKETSFADFYIYRRKLP